MGPANRGKATNPGGVSQDLRADVPLYLRIKETLKNHILDGDYGVGDRLPSESRLRAAFGVSRDTVRQALVALQEEQLIESLQGKGHFVCRAKAVQDLGRLQGLGESVADVGMEVRSRVIGARQCAADDRVAEVFNLPPGAPVVELRRVRYINRQPASLDISYFPLDAGRRLMDADLTHRDVFDILENDLDLPLQSANITIEVDRADPETAEALDMQPGEPVLRIERLTCTLGNEALDFEYIVARGDSYQFRVRVPRF